MERDFMGLNSKDSLVVKEEVVEGACQDSGFGRSLGVPWLLSNKASALPHFMSLKSEKDEKSSKIIKSDLLACHGFGVKSGSDMFEAMQKRQSADIQNFSISKQQYIGANTHSVLPSTATDQRINSKTSNGPAQLTIFYGGTVNVFDDITPEKAQAIMFLAGTGCVSSSMAQSMLHMQAPASKHPITISSHLIDQSNGVPASNNDDVKVPKNVGISNNLVNNVEPPRLMQSIGSVAASAMISSAVPQARKASLARFLEKRKERVMSASPYSMSKNTADCATPESVGFGFSATSGVGSSSVQGD